MFQTLYSVAGFLWKSLLFVVIYYMPYTLWCCGFFIGLDIFNPNKFKVPRDSGQEWMPFYEYDIWCDSNLLI